MTSRSLSLSKTSSFSFAVGRESASSAWLQILSRKMTYTAELFLQYVFHFKMFGCLLFNIEYIGMTIHTVKPLHMRCMGKYSRGDSAPLCPEFKQFVKIQRFLILINTVFRLYGPILKSF